ncbi:MAG: helix-turn-helix transcriptional regulator [Hyphomonadaceae bacterium]
MSQASVTDRAKLAYGDDLAHRVEAVGRDMNLPFIAVSADIGSPDPVFGPDGRPYAETLFRWIDPKLRYWEDRGFALRARVLHAVRVCAEPFYLAGDKLASWRPHAALQAFNEGTPTERFGVHSAIIAPAYLSGGVIGAIVWASPDTIDVASIFAQRAETLHALALRFVATHNELAARRIQVTPAPLTRREIQCLKWAAMGKTDSDISEIMHISLPTVRFHITNATRKLNVVGRPQAIYRAATLGYVGAVTQG